MPAISVKLYSILRLDYAKKNSYDSNKGIELNMPEPATIRRICGMIGIDAAEVYLVTINGVMKKDPDIDETIKEGAAEIGLHPRPPAGG
jgi:hypothetical protein